MGFCSAYSEDAREKLEEKLVDIGKGLAGLPSSTPKLKALLQKIERVLLFVWQQPPESTAKALAPTTKVLLSDELLQHMDPNIQMIYASCMNEITRIALPGAPYDDGEMKKIFRLFMVALKGLSNVSEGVTETVNDIRAQRILLAMSKLKTCLIMLDLECDEMVIDMFNFFFNTIKSDHPSDIFENMATVMTLMIEDMDRIPLQLVEILLSSVKLDNKDASPRSFELGKSVFERCSTRLQPHVREAVDGKNLDIKAYTDIVSSLCQDVHNQENMVAEEEVETVQSMTIDPSSEDASIVEGNSSDERKDGPGEVMDENENTLEALKCCGQIVQLKNDNTESDTPVAEHSEAGPQSDVDEVTTRKRRGRKPNSLLRPEEGYLHAWAIGGQVSHRFSGDVVSKEKKDLPSPSEPVKEDVPSSSFGKELDSIDAASNPTKVQSQNTESEANQQIAQEMPLRRKRKTLQSNVKEGGSNTGPKRRRRRRDAGQIAPNVMKEEVNHSSNETKGEDIKQKRSRRRSILDGNASQKHDKKDTMDKTGDSSVSKREEADEPQNLTPEKHSKMSSAEYGEELISSRIMVWWPMDKTFYTGTVVSYDSTLKYHKVIYDDDEEEVLNLKTEKWELFSEDHPRQVQTLPEEETDRPSPVKQPSTVQRKVTRRRGGLSRKQVSSSKRPRSEVRNAVKSESGDEPSETYFS